MTCNSAFVRCRAFEGLQEYFYVFGKWFLVFFKNDIWSGNIFFSFRIERFRGYQHPGTLPGCFPAGAGPSPEEVKRE